AGGDRGVRGPRPRAGAVLARPGAGREDRPGHRPAGARAGRVPRPGEPGVPVLRRRRQALGGAADGGGGGEGVSLVHCGKAVLSWRGVSRYGGVLMAVPPAERMPDDSAVDEARRRVARPPRPDAAAILARLDAAKGVPGP